MTAFIRGMLIVPLMVVCVAGGVFIPYWLDGPLISVKRITTVCASHQGVQQIDAGLNKNSTFIVCRDGVVGKP